jgi:DNA-binding ferritin-like protein
MQMIGQLIATMFLSREMAHRAHLAATGTGSFSKHMALGEFYPAIIEIADSITEAYQGRHSLIEIPYLDEPDDYATDIIKILEKHLEDIEGLRYAAVDKKDTPIQNLIDEAVGIYLSALYKLKNLK